MRLPFKNIRLAPPLVAGIVALIVLAGFGGIAYGSTVAKTSAPTGALAAHPTAAVTIQNFAFTPKTLTVKAGTTVTWTNKDSMPHNVVSAKSLATNAATTGLFNSQLGQGQRFSFTFKKAGTYFYECTIHKALASMHAKIIVKK